MDSSAFAQIYPGGLFLFLADEPLPDAVDTVIGDAKIIVDLAARAVDHVVAAAPTLFLTVDKTVVALPLDLGMRYLW